jgi:hypothetical protein
MKAAMGTTWAILLGDSPCYHCHHLYHYQTLSKFLQPSAQVLSLCLAHPSFSHPTKFLYLLTSGIAHHCQMCQVKYKHTQC